MNSFSKDVSSDLDRLNDDFRNIRIMIDVI